MTRKAQSTGLAIVVVVALVGLGLVVKLAKDSEAGNVGFRPAALPTTAVRNPTEGIACHGDGDDGFRVQAVYAFAADQPDRYMDARAEIVEHMKTVEVNVADSAAETGGVRRVRWALGADCGVSITKVQLSETGDDSFTTTVAEMRKLGYERFDRAYLIWMDAAIMCGLGSVLNDDRKGIDNANYFGPAWTRVDRPCWGRAETHEFGHNLGAVQVSAPHSNQNIHCTDDFDAMCYDDAGLGNVVVTCPEQARERLYDCNHDDYFHTNPPAGSYLDTHWNAADSAFLSPHEPRSPDDKGTFHAIDPIRVMGSSDLGKPIAESSNGQTRVSSRLLGAGGIPLTGVDSVVVTLTLTDAKAPGEMHVESLLAPTSLDKPSIKYPPIPYKPGRTASVSSVVQLGAPGVIELVVRGGDVRVSVDVNGWFGDGSGEGEPGGILHPVPARNVAESKSPALLATNEFTGFDMTGRYGIPSEGVGAVLIELSASAATEPTQLIAWSGGALVPAAATLAMEPRESATTLVFVKVNDKGSIAIHNRYGLITIGVKVLGWFGDGGSRSTSADVGGLRYRSADHVEKVRGSGSHELQFSAQSGVPVDRAVIVITSATGSSHASPQVEANITSPWGSGQVSVMQSSPSNPSALTAIAADREGHFGLTGSATATLDVDVIGWFE